MKIVSALVRFGYLILVGVFVGFIACGWLMAFGGDSWGWRVLGAFWVSFGAFGLYDAAHKSGVFR